MTEPEDGPARGLRAREVGDRPDVLTIDLRAALGALSVAALGCTLGYCGHGAFSIPALCGVLLALGAALAACTFRTARLIPMPAAVGTVAILACSWLLPAVRLLFRFHTAEVPLLWAVGGTALPVTGGVALGKVRPCSAAVGLLAAIAFLLSGSAVFWPRLAFGEAAAGRILLQAASLMGFLLVVISLFLDLNVTKSVGRTFWVRLGLLFLTGALVRVGAVIASPDPAIDVYSWLQNAPRYVLHGQNPYAAEYPDPYATARGAPYRPAKEPASEGPRRVLSGYVYPPLSIVVTLPCAAAGVDVRYANVACDLLAAGVLFLAAWRRRAPVIGALACAVHLHSPCVPLVTENAWVEPMLAATLGGGLLLVERGHWLGRLLLALGLTGKQYGIALLPALAATHWKQAWRLLAWCALVGAAVILPFFLWGPRAFLEGILWKHLGYAPDLDSLTLGSAAHRLLGVEVPGSVLAGVAAVLIGWVSWRGREEGCAAALWLGASLLAFCLCFVQGYVNYFYLCGYLLLLGTAALAADSEKTGLPR